MEPGQSEIGTPIRIRRRPTASRAAGPGWRQDAGGPEACEDHEHVRRSDPEPDGSGAHRRDARTVSAAMRRTRAGRALPLRASWPQSSSRARSLDHGTRRRTGALAVERLRAFGLPRRSSPVGRPRVAHRAATIPSTPVELVEEHFPQRRAIRPSPGDPRPRGSLHDRRSPGPRTRAPFVMASSRTLEVRSKPARASIAASWRVCSRGTRMPATIGMAGMLRNRQEGRLTRRPSHFRGSAGCLQLPGLDSNQQPSG